MTVANKERVKKAMRSVGINTMTELANEVGITKNQLSLILSNRYNPIKSTFFELSEVLRVTPDKIIDFQEKNKKKNKKIIKTCKYSAIELFAGGGGLALGLEQAGIETILHVVNDKYCCDTLSKNRPNWNVICSDVSKVDFKPYKGKINIVTGGFPCQAFSYAGKKLGFEDTRGTLFYEFARCVKETEPIIFVAENVRGLISHDNGRTLKTIIDIFESLGYNIQTKLLNAVNYNVPQKRERIVIVGTKKGTNIKFEYPKESKKIKTLRDALKNVPKSEGQAYSAAKKAVFKLVPPGGCWRDLPLNVQKSYMGKSFTSGGGRTGMARRISWDEPCLTLTCSPSQKQTDRCHPDEVRPFTVREYARIQTFPDDWEFTGGIGQKYKQIGNAVPVELARQIGVQITKAIDTYTK